MTVEEKRRELFEAYVKKANPEDYTESGDELFVWNGASYVWTWVNWDWMLWNAAIDSICIILPHSYQIDECEEDGNSCWMAMPSERVVAAIQAAGVTSK